MMMIVYVILNSRTYLFTIHSIYSQWGERYDEDNGEVKRIDS